MCSRTHDAGVRIFLSYATPSDGPDLEVQRFRDTLEARLRERCRRDVHVVIDRRDFTPGRSADDEIAAQLGRCDAVVWLLSPAWLTSDWCFGELRVARLTDLAGVPVSWADVAIDDIPESLRAAIRVDMTRPSLRRADNDEGMATIDALIRGLRDAAPALRDARVPPRAHRRRQQRNVAVAMLVLTAALGASIGAGSAAPNHAVVVALLNANDAAQAAARIAAAGPAVVALTPAAAEVVASNPGLLRPLHDKNVRIVAAHPTLAGATPAWLAWDRQPVWAGGAIRGTLLSEDAILVALTGVAPPPLAGAAWLPAAADLEGHPMELAAAALAVDAASRVLRGRPVVMDVRIEGDTLTTWSTPWPSGQPSSAGRILARLVDHAHVGTLWWRVATSPFATLLLIAGALVAATIGGRYPTATLTLLGAVWAMAALAALYNISLPLWPLVLPLLWIAWQSRGTS